VSCTRVKVHQCLAGRLPPCQFKVYLPAYSPDFTPIEHALSKLTAWLRRMEARTREALEEAIAAALAAITATDAARWFTACGYPLPKDR